jgi:hypothetical protein
MAGEDGRAKVMGSIRFPRCSWSVLEGPLTWGFVCASPKINV